MQTLLCLLLTKEKTVQQLYVGLMLVLLSCLILLNRGEQYVTLNYSNYFYWYFSLNVVALTKFSHYVAIYYIIIFLET